MRLIPIVAACAFLFACGKPAKPAAESENTASRPVKLQFWHIMNYAGPREILGNTVKRFEADHPDCEIQTQTFENDAYKVKLAVELASGTPPDILFTWGGGHLAEQVKADKVLDLTPFLSQNAWKDSFIDSALNICSVDGKAYAVPLDLSCVLLWCNKALFQENHLDFPKTYADMLALCPAFRAKGIEPFALGNKNQWTGAFYFCYLANRIGGTDLFYQAAQNPGLFAGDAFVDAGEKLRALVDAKAFPTGFNGLDDGPARARFLAGRSAMLLMGSWVVARVKTEKPEFLENMAALPFPAVEGGKGDAATVLGGVNCGFAVSKSCKNPELAIEFLRYLTAPQVVSEWCEIGRIPALKTTPEQEAKLPAPTREALQALRAAPSLQPYYDQSLSPKLAVKHKNTTQNIFAGTMTPKQAADEMAKGN